MKSTHCTRFVMNKGRVALLTAISIAASGLPATQALAQRGLIEEVVVTATRREENLQEVPLAITAVSGIELNNAGIDAVNNMNATIPNLSVAGGGNSGESQANFRVRGMPGVSFYIDGINQSSTDGLFTMGVLEVERIEVLRGPQGTLFGNASLGGAINYVTRQPANEAGGNVRATVGSYNRRDVVANINIPLTDNLLSKFTYASLSRDGFVQSVTADRAYGDINDELVRADFLWTPLDNVSVRYNAR